MVPGKNLGQTLGFFHGPAKRKSESPLNFRFWPVCDVGDKLLGRAVNDMPDMLTESPAVSQRS